MRSIRVVTFVSLAALLLIAALPSLATAKPRVWQPRLLPGAAGFAAAAGASPSTSRAYVPGQLLVEFRAGASGAGDGP